MADSIFRCTISRAFVMTRVVTAFLFKIVRAAMAEVVTIPRRAMPIAISTNVIPFSRFMRRGPKQFAAVRRAMAVIGEGFFIITGARWKLLSPLVAKGAPAVMVFIAIGLSQIHELMACLGVK
jgi:fatty acid desaturase